jgi:hypothetical protein
MKEILLAKFNSALSPTSVHPSDEMQDFDRVSELSSLKYTFNIIICLFKSKHQQETEIFSQVTKDIEEAI